MEMVTTCQGINFPLACRALRAATFQPPQQGTLHAQNGQAGNLVLAQDLGEFFAVIHTVQLGAADEG